MKPFMARMPWLPPVVGDFSAQCRALKNGTSQSGAKARELAAYALNTTEAATLSRAIAARQRAGDSLAPLLPFRLGILCSSTIDLLCDCLPSAAARYGVELELVRGAYGQVMQDALDPASVINKARVDAVLVHVDHRWLRLDKADLSDRPEARVEAAVDQLRAIVLALREHSSAAPILQTIPCPPDPLFGALDRRHQGSVRGMIDAVNIGIVRIAGELSAQLVDTAALAERIGTDHWFDAVQWTAYKLPFQADVHPIFSDSVARVIGAMLGRSRKCLVLDLDNTLWGGVIGDDGLAGIKVGQDGGDGEAFLAVQLAALELRARGVFLAVCSKNTDAVARGPFREHKDMLIRESDISVFQANWLDKPSNLEAIAKVLNIGLDALVLLDDNPAERSHVRAALPDVAVPELPNDPSLFPRYLLAAGYFETTEFSAEDRLRVASFDSNARRAEVLATKRDLGEYLAELGSTISFDGFNAQDRARTTQLINKTNQFNLTSRRYTLEDVAAIEGDLAAYGLTARVSDKFSDFGLIAVVICRSTLDATWNIDSWLMSCRVLGRRIEEAVLCELVRVAAEAGVRRLRGLYHPTGRNGMVAEMYLKLGFEPENIEPDGHRTFTLDISDFRPSALPLEVLHAYKNSAAAE